MSSDDQHHKRAEEAFDLAKGQGVIYGPVVGVNYGQVSPVYNIRRAPLRPLFIDETTLALGTARLAAMPESDTEPLPMPSALPVPSRMPVRRNPLFVGRESELRAIARVLKVERTATITTGLGGVGKTQLAAEFVHRYGQFFTGGVFWLSLSNPATVATEVAACGGPGVLELYQVEDALTLEEQMRRVLGAWASDLPRLLVFDSCEDESLLAEWLPTTGGCRVLVTSRRVLWDAALGVVTLPLDVLARTQSIALVKKHRPDLNDAEANVIAQELGDLPLALHLAGSYLARYRGEAVDVYLERLRSAAVLEDPSMQGGWIAYRPTGRELHVARVFALSADRLDQANPVDMLSIALLARSARLAPGNPIPRSLLAATLAKFHKNDREIEEAIRRILDLGLIEEEASGALRQHRLICAFAQERIVDVDAQLDVEEGIAAQTSEINNTRNPLLFTALHTHLRAVTDMAMAREDDDAARLCSSLGYQLLVFGKYSDARVYYSRALEIDRAIHGSEHDAVVSDLQNLAHLSQNEGDYATALRLYRETFETWEKAGRHGTPTAAILFHNYASLLKEIGEYDAALPLYEQALRLDIDMYGTEHIEVAIDLNNLGELRRLHGDFVAAQELYQRAINVFEQLKDTPHPGIAAVYNNLADVSVLLGKYHTAKELYEQSLKIAESSLGKDHPDVATVLGNIGWVLYRLGNYTGAQEYYERSLAIIERDQSTTHPRYAAVLNNMAELLSAQQQQEAALPLYRRAVSIVQNTLGSDHPYVAQTLNNMGDALFALQDYVAARKHYEMALELRIQKLGSDHIDAAASMRSLAHLLILYREFEDAAGLLLQAYEVHKETLEEDHPTTQEIKKEFELAHNFLVMHESLADMEDYVAGLIANGTVEERVSYADQLEGLAISYPLIDLGNTAAPYPYLPTKLRQLAARLRVMQ